VEIDQILGVAKTPNGKLMYFIKWKTNNIDQSDFIDSWIMKKLYPQIVISFYEKIITWRKF